MIKTIKKVALVSGGMDPVHPGHVRMFKAAKNLADVLVVALNSDEWLKRKKGRAFMPFDYREELINEMECVDEVVKFNDDDDTANDALKQARELYPDAKILFCNGGDRDEGNVPEEVAAKEHDIELVYGVGGDYKLTASSELLRKYTYPTDQRPWGEFTVLFDGPEYKLKELLVHPGSSWFIIKFTISLS